MNMTKLFLSAAIIVGMAGTAQAQDRDEFYINLGVDSYDFDAYGIGAKLGHNFTENFGVEGQASFGIIDDEETIGGIEIDTNIDYSAGLFGVVRTQDMNGISLFARAGYHYTEATSNAENLNLKETIDVDGFAVGAGAQYMFDGLNGVRAEYTYYDADDGGELDVFSLSYVRKF